MSRLRHPYAVRIAALAMWRNPAFELRRRLVWFAWSQDDPDGLGIEPSNARKRLLRGLKSGGRFRLAIAAGMYLVCVQHGKQLAVGFALAAAIILARFIGWIIG